MAAVIWITALGPDRVGVGTLPDIQRTIDRRFLSGAHGGVTHRLLEKAAEGLGDGHLPGAPGGFALPLDVAPAGTDAVDRPTFEGRPNWFGPVGNECRAAREALAEL